MTCTCGIIKVGGKETSARELDFDCPEHGKDSEFYNSPEEVFRREERSKRLRELQKMAAQAVKRAQSR